MASADCGCCGQPTTPSDPVRAEEIEFDDCDCPCFDCDDCGDCDDHGTVVVSFTPVVLCDDCDPDREECGEGAWHCDGSSGHSCDGTGCPDADIAAGRTTVHESADAMIEYLHGLHSMP